MATYDELMAAARKAHAKGDKTAAKRFLELAAAQSKAAPKPQPNPDGTYGQPPEGMVFNPNTGQMTSRELLANHAVQAGMGAGQAGLAGAVQGGTFGLSDELMAAANAAIPGAGTAGQRYDFGLEAGRAQLEAARSASPVAAYGGEIAGAMAAPVGALSSAGGLTMRALKGAATGGLQGLLYGYGAGEGGAQERASNAAWTGGIGAAVGGAIPFAGEGIKRIANALMSREAIKEAVRAAPTTEALKQIGRQAYDDVDKAGVRVRPEVFAQTVDDITGQMKAGGMREGVGRSLTPGGAEVADTLRDVATDPQFAGGVPFSEVDVLRRLAGVPAADMGNRLDSKLGTQVIEGLDDMVNRLDDTQVTAGDPEALKGAIGKAREIWGRMSRSQLVDDAIDKSQDYLSGETSGIRNQFARILRSDKLRRGFNAAEIAAMRKVVRGTIPERMVNMFGSGLGQLTAVGVGAGAGSAAGPVGAILGGMAGTIPAVAARNLSERMTQRSAEVARALIASGAARQVMPTLSASKQAAIEAIMRQLARGVSPVAAQQ